MSITTSEEKMVKDFPKWIIDINPKMQECI